MQSSQLNDFLHELKTITDIESPASHISGVDQVADWFIQKAEKLGLSHKKIPMNSDKVADCLLISNNPDAEQFDILFIAHMDTVFPVGTASYVPFTNDRERINALGVIDDKSGALLSFYVLQELDLTKYNIAVYLNSHEEIGSTYAKDSIREYARKAKYCFVMEPAREDGSMVATRKGVITYKIDFHGVAAHAGNNPERGRSALVEAANFIVEFSKLNDFEVGHTFNCVINNGGSAHNVIADFASLTIEMRYRLPSSVEYFERHLKRVLDNPFVAGVTATKVLVNSEAPMIDEVNLPKVKQIFDEVGKQLQYPIKWVDAGGLSDGNIAAASGCLTIDGLGPTGGNMHAKTEYLEVNSIVPKCNLVVAVIKRLFDAH
ncbi:M20/M25/M40 family metallo-hydrolase [Actinobacillus equuli subsp. equuli]|uniref:Carboxypeptidase G2 n=1 Tax=Actinobacillus equuli TaxID=718 RepID=A0AAX3FI84_ACTEU|nr:M20/M25/M40 family metallo-hydrolase [Actinobacillus equuli]AIZ79688.1 peptidase M20 [Actinobacillus equuli subsp. equuli]MDG4952922.1 M20/M25/M40 family metallo-hydrolase [Actinobacillus equuli subsp. equuli]WGE43798.1 M20/M25/M40 family metallo-hydrolase [Actinobacillus equuli subsp. equuli]WGE54435.1 M20/M25/M40 family metallo-hydrolase [Actinobacillus equuli subsp. equuli]WGE56520.1 M20/M25/M40 family metallo-hydrolase [Actinobacillus equuli subsp. equuli]